MREIKEEMEVKKGNTYETTRTITDKATIYEDLSAALIAKKIHNCTYITRITDSCNYDGTRTITVNYNNGCRCRFTVKA